MCMLFLVGENWNFEEKKYEIFPSITFQNNNNFLKNKIVCGLRISIFIFQCFLLFYHLKIFGRWWKNDEIFIQSERDVFVWWIDWGKFSSRLWIEIDKLRLICVCLFKIIKRYPASNNLPFSFLMKLMLCYQLEGMENMKPQEGDVCEIYMVEYEINWSINFNYFYLIVFFPRLKTEFMIQLDGAFSNNGSFQRFTGINSHFISPLIHSLLRFIVVFCLSDDRILVIGATNLPNEIDTVFFSIF